MNGREPEKEKRRSAKRLEAVDSQLLVDGLESSAGVGDGSGALLGGSDLALVEGLLLDLALSLELVNNLHVVPSDFVRDALDGAVLASWLEPESTQSGGDDNLLLAVVRGRDTLEELQALQSGSTTSRLVGNHAADGLVQDARWSAEVEGTSAGWVDQVSLVQVCVVAQLWRGM